MTAVCVALVLWLALVAAVLIFPAFARIIGAAVLILLIATMAAAIAEERRVETSPQYRGAWCSTKWNTVYRRCKEFDDGWTLTINRQTVMSEDQVCELSAVRKGSGEHRVWLSCRSDAGDSKSQERWRLGTNRTRLQILYRMDEP
jgi:hypothetical protein